MNNHKKFTVEFKRSAVDLVLNQGYSISQAAESLGISESALRRWVKRTTQELSGHTPIHGRAITKEQQEIQDLKKRICQLEKEKDILKKASALLISESR